MRLRYSSTCFLVLHIKKFQDQLPHKPLESNTLVLKFLLLSLPVSTRFMKSVRNCEKRCDTLVRTDMKSLNLRAVCILIKFCIFKK